jgi:hypothetical protein
MNHKEGYLLRKLQRDLSLNETWCKRWNFKISLDKHQALYFSHRLRPPKVHLILNGLKSPFVKHVKYLSVFYNKRIAYRNDRSQGLLNIS